MIFFNLTSFGRRPWIPGHKKWTRFLNSSHINYYWCYLVRKPRDEKCNYYQYGHRWCLILVNQRVQSTIGRSVIGVAKSSCETLLARMLHSYLAAPAWYWLINSLNLISLLRLKLVFVLRFFIINITMNPFVVPTLIFSRLIYEKQWCIFSVTNSRCRWQLRSPKPWNIDPTVTCERCLTWFLLVDISDKKLLNRGTIIIRDYDSWWILILGFVNFLSHTHTSVH